MKHYTLKLVCRKAGCPVEIFEGNGDPLFGKHKCMLCNEEMEFHHFSIRKNQINKMKKIELIRAIEESGLCFLCKYRNNDFGENECKDCGYGLMTGEKSRFEYDEEAI